MKKAIFFLLSAALLAAACQKYDDSVLKNRIGDLENRVTSLEATVNTLNGNVSSVQTLVQALQDDITISVISKNKDGFTITFSDGQSVEIQNGEKGSQGDKGDTPVIGVKADGDVFYWTADGEWLVDASGNKVAVSGGIPTLKIENDHWYASYDGTTWQDLGEVDVMGGSTDLSITEDDNFVYFAFKSTGETIKISKSTRFTIDIEGTDYVLLDGKRVEIPYSIFGADGTERLFIQGNGFTTSYDASKIYVTPNDGVTGGDVLVYAVRNSDQRMCGVVLSFGEGVFTVTEAAKIPAAGGDVSVTVRTNLTYEVVIPEEAQSWLSVAVSTKAAVREDAVTFTAQPNEGAARTAAVTLKAQGAATLTVTVYQEGKGGSTPSGTLENPYTPAGASDAVKDLTWTSNTEYDKTEKVYVKGKISRIANNGKYAESGTFGNASYWISADGTENEEFQIYRSLYFNGEKYTSGTDIKVGDEVIIYGALMNYRGNTPETVANESWLYSLNGATSGGDDSGQGQGGDTPGDVKAVTVSEFLAAAESDTQVYELVGVIGETANTTYGNFDLTDDSGTVYVYGLTATNLGYGAKNDKSYASLDLKTGDQIKIHGYRGSYTNTSTGETKDEVVYAWFIEKLASGEGGGGDEQPEGSIVIDFSAQGYANAEEFSSLTVEGITVTGDKGTNSNGPKFYTTGNAIRFYGSNSLTLSASKKIESVEFTFSSGEGTNEISASTGTWKEPNWTGSASSITFTIGGTSGHRRIQKLVVTLAK